ncbi:hypothetical protein CSOJ01_05241 [Colletotrichum sojae]|uniref:Uncharacterized protein n=1 Tax=Colletotrichum sojae TaxID=2175907 RepID=A0A8H6MX48_9PEZI|nr:hypothetical protein CSOJ01_05241 [Colletotrichum sojae]
MKSTSTLSLFFVTAVLFQGLAAAWNFPSLQFPLVPTWLGGSPPTPNVPKFVLDAQHPWLEAHAGELAALDDPTSLLCTPLKVDIASSDPKSIECGHGFESRGLSGEDVPGDFFKRLEIDNNRYRIDRLGWDNARQRLLEMRDCPRALDEVRELKVDIWVDKREGETTPPPDVPQLFAQVLGSMANLEKIDWRLREYKDDYEANLAFGEAFLGEGVRLSAAEVTANMYATWLFDAAPSARVLEVGREYWGFPKGGKHHGYFKTWLRAASKLKELRGLNLGGVQWAADMTEREHTGSVLDETDASQRVVRALVAMPKLEKLHLPVSWELDLGLDGGPLCGNMFDGEDGERLRIQMAMESIEAMERAGGIVRAELPGLKGVQVGNSYGNFTTDGEGRNVTVWPWSGGRVEEWINGD